MSEMIKRVAMAICGAQGWYPGEPSNVDYKAARAAIEAMRDPVIGQVSAAARKADVVGAGDFVAIWNAMIDAALADGEG